jgi:hypothetical protein
MDQVVHQLAGKGPELRHCMFCGPNETPHLFDKCPILNDKRFASSLAIRLGSSYTRSLQEAKQRQIDARNGTSPKHEQRRPGRPDPHAARIHQVFTNDPAIPPATPSHPDFLSDEFTPGQNSDPFFN